MTFLQHPRAEHGSLAFAKDRSLTDQGQILWPWKFWTDHYDHLQRFTAQTWFNRGLTWTYAFNHAEAAYCFEQAVAHDPSCAIAY